jgi:hypothetical protein
MANIIQLASTLLAQDRMMIKTIVIVDDAAERAQFLLREARQRGFESSWWRPMPPKQFSDDPLQHGEMRLESRGALIDKVKECNLNRIVWVWDVRLIFNFANGATEKFDTEDYEWPRNDKDEHLGEEPELRRLLLARLVNGDRIVLISTYHACERLCSNWISDFPEINGRVYGHTESWSDMVSTRTASTAFRKLKSDWITSVVKKALELAGHKTKPNLQELWVEERLSFYTPGSVIPHEFGDANWSAFWSFLADWWKVPNTSYQLLCKEMEGSFQQYFYAAMTLVGAHARCHSSKGYPPSLSVISLLMIRAALLSGFYSDEDMAGLAKKVKPGFTDRDVVLCDIIQDRSYTQSWLCVLADEVLPILVGRHRGGGPAEIADCHCDVKRRTFSIRYSGNWEKLLDRFHSLDGKEGALSGALIRLNTSLGDCGKAVGRRQRCIVNAFHEEEQTIIEFAVT